MTIKAGLAAAATLLLGASEPWDWGDAKEDWYDASDYAESKAICRSVKDREPPAADRPDAATAASLKGCDSEALYYGVGMKADPVRARQCAFLEMEQDSGAVLSGRTMLMTIYANGIGAKRDLDVATHLACGIEGAPMESHGRVLHLAQMKTEKRNGEDFHFCYDVTSGLAMGYCASHQARIEAAKRDSALAALAGSWTPEERQAFERLRSAHKDFAEAHSAGEIDLGGTARAARQIDAEEELYDEFLKMVQYLASGRVPRNGPIDFKGADRALNTVYRMRLAKLRTETYPGAVTRQGVRDAQRAWLRYRDAFLAFAAVKFKAVPSESLATWLTRNRTAMLLGSP